MEFLFKLLDIFLLWCALYTYIAARLGTAETLPGDLSLKRCCCNKDTGGESWLGI